MTAGGGPCHGQASFSGGTHTVHRGRDASWETKSGWPVHRGVLRYSTEVIDIAAADMTVRITGRELQLLAMTDRELRISGTITAIELLT